MDDVGLVFMGPTSGIQAVPVTGACPWIRMRLAITMGGNTTACTSSIVYDGPSRPFLSAGVNIIL
jgi:hypothetical protein